MNAEYQLTQCICHQVDIKTLNWINVFHGNINKRTLKAEILEHENKILNRINSTSSRNHRNHTYQQDFDLLHVAQELLFPLEMAQQQIKLQ